MIPMLPVRSLKSRSQKKINGPLYDLGFNAVKELETEQGILASGRSEVYGCIFGRDSLITSLKLLQVYKKTKNEDCLRIIKKTLQTLSHEQGKEINIESGEEPGKVIHEFRPQGHEHLTQGPEKWYLYPDQVMRNYDTIDATPLYLITVYRYLQISGDIGFVEQLLPHIKAGLQWVLEFADSNHDGLVDYTFKEGRKYGGLKNQMWMDSTESTFHEDGSMVRYPLAPIEAQAYVYCALRLWSIFFAKRNAQFSGILLLRAQQLKELFNELFLVHKGKLTYFAHAIDAAGKPLEGIRSNMGHCLWASLTKEEDGITGGIVSAKYIPAIVTRLMAPDIFEPKAGIRTLSELSRNFSPNSYHNGSIWPHDNSIIAQGLDNYGYHRQAKRVRQAYLQAIAHFNTPIELYVYWNGLYTEWTLLNGQTSCKQQAWSAASVLADTLLLVDKRSPLWDRLAASSLLLILFQDVEFKRFQKIIKSGMEKLTHTIPLKTRR